MFDQILDSGGFSEGFGGVRGGLFDDFRGDLFLIVFVLDSFFPHTYNTVVICFVIISYDVLYWARPHSVQIRRLPVPPDLLLLVLCG